MHYLLFLVEVCEHRKSSFASELGTAHNYGFTGCNGNIQVSWICLTHLENKDTNHTHITCCMQPQNISRFVSTVTNDHFFKVGVSFLKFHFVTQELALMLNTRYSLTMKLWCPPLDVFIICGNVQLVQTATPHSVIS